MTAVALKLRDDAYYAETSTGTYVLLPHGEVTLEGSSVHRWIERLAPHLDGSRSLEELTAGLPEARRAFVTGLVHTLVERGIVREIALDGVQSSTRYPGGVALRFARVKRYRPDKDAAEADTIDALRALLPASGR